MEIQKCSCTVFPFRYHDSGSNCFDPAVPDLQQIKPVKYQNMSDHYVHSICLSLSIYLVQGYLRSFPDDIMEAAVIDGCGIYRLMWHIVTPLMKNSIVTVLVLQFFFKWNDLLFSMTFISDSALKTVQTGLLYFSDEFGSRTGCNFRFCIHECIPTSDSVHGTE